MSVNLSIKHVSEEVVERLHRRAKRNHRSLQGEMLSILENTAMSRRISVDEADKHLRALNFTTGSDSVRMIRKDRDGR